MSISRMPDADRWEELQITRLLFGLSFEEQSEFDDLAPKTPAEQSELFEQVVAWIDVAWSDSKSMPLPDHLRKAIRSRAMEELTTQALQSVDKPTVAKAAVVRSSKLPWVAAACIVITVLTLFSSRQNEPANVVRDAAQQRAKLISTAKDLVQVNWNDGPTPISGAEGDVSGGRRVRRVALVVRPLDAEGLFEFKVTPAISRRALQVFAERFGRLGWLLEVQPFLMERSLLGRPPMDRNPNHYFQAK